MEYLKCFTVKDDIEEGIYVNNFESIIVADPSTTSIKKATIEMVPVFPMEGDTANNMTEGSLVFLHEAGNKDKESTEHIVIAVDPSKWKLCYRTDSLGILDPCGLNGFLLLLVDRSMEHVLVKADDRSLSLQFKDNKLTIEKCGRAAMLRDAVTKRRLTMAASKLPSRCLLRAPKDE